MIAALLAVSFVQPASLPAKLPLSANPCLAAPKLCASADRAPLRMDVRGSLRGPDNKMSAYGFDARPCRIIGNMGCPKKARMRLFRLGEPLRETLMRSFMPR